MGPIREQTIFLEALDKDPAERAAFLEEACAGDAALRRGVEALLRLHEGPHQFLKVSVVEQLTAPASGLTDAMVDLSFLAPPSEPGSLGRLDLYEVLEVVGRGGTGVVLRARDTKLLRAVALKVLAAPLAASGSARQRFVREARAAAAVRDEHVIGIHAVCDDSPVPYLVMEFIDGENLEALIRRQGPLDVKEVLRIGIQAASGLAAAHKQGLIHRDVKPANILLENGVQRVKLTDFGLARAVDDASLTQSGLIAGTPAYMSPEQANGEPVDSRSDLFSLGSVLYEMSTGRPAFRASTTVAVIKRVCDETSRPIREVNPEVPQVLCRLIEGLHAKNPADRPASAVEVADQLSQLLADLQGRGPAPSADPDCTVAPGRVTLPRRRLWAAAALALLVVGLGMGEATGVTEMSGMVIRLFSPEGTLVVEIDDPSVSVTVEGCDLVMTGAGAREIRLKPGSYKVEASKDGEVVRQELVTISRNGSRVARFSKESLQPGLARKQPTPSDAQTWERLVDKLPAGPKFQEVVSRLKELNPEFDGDVTPEVINNQITGLILDTNHVEDISPVRAIRTLRWLDCSGHYPEMGRLSDLTPLRGMLLTSLKCCINRVNDLGPLRGMPLVILNCGSNPLADLSPLTGMRLERLEIQSTQVSDLTPVREMPLTWLDLHYLSRISDLSLIDGMHLEYLNVTGLPLTDISLLARQQSLQWLVLDRVPVSDLAPLRGLQISNLNIKGTRVFDLSPIERMPLRLLRLDYRPDLEKFLRSFPGLEVINDQPAPEFWKSVARKSG